MTRDHHKMQIKLDSFNCGPSGENDRFPLDSIELIESHHHHHHHIIQSMETTMVYLHSNAFKATSVYPIKLKTL